MEGGGFSCLVDCMDCLVDCMGCLVDCMGCLVDCMGKAGTSTSNFVFSLVNLVVRIGKENGWTERERKGRTGGY